MSAIYGGENVIVITGLPGNGKTLFALKLVREIEQETKRLVFTSGVNGINIEGWKQLDDATQWHQCPPGSIIVIDEGQRVFEPAGPGQKLPPHLSEMNTVRHKGILLVITTQHPHLLHMNVRKLTQRHFHLVRKFGAQKASIFHWPMVADVGTRAALLASCKSAQRMEWGYPKEVFNWYKSAEIHTVKRRIPIQFWVALCSVPIVVGLGWLAWHAVRGFQSAPMEIAKAAGASPSTASQGGSRASGPLTTGEFLKVREPRIEGFAHTAQVYDEVTKPVRAPYPAACVHREASAIHGHAADCTCYTDQATKLRVPQQVCEQIVSNGYYVDWDIEKGREQHNSRSDDRGAVRAAEPPPAPSVVRPDAVAASATENLLETPIEVVGRGHWLPPSPMSKTAAKG